MEGCKDCMTCDELATCPTREPVMRLNDLAAWMEERGVIEQPLDTEHGQVVALLIARLFGSTLNSTALKMPPVLMPVFIAPMEVAYWYGVQMGLKEAQDKKEIAQLEQMFQGEPLKKEE